MLMKKLGLFLACVFAVTSLVQASIVFDGAAGFESSQFTSNNTEFREQSVKGLFYQTALGLSFSITPLFRVPLLVEMGTGNVYGQETYSSKDNVKRIKGLIGLVAKPSIRIGDGRLYMVTGIQLVKVRSLIDLVLKNSNSYRMGVVGGGLSYQVMPDLDFYSELRTYVTKSVNIYSTATDGVNKSMPSRYGRHRVMVGLTYYFL